MTGMSGVPAGAVTADGADGCRILCLATPRASRSALCGWHDGRLKVALAAPPVDGAANMALLTLLAEVLKIPKRDLAVTAGLSARRKVVLVKGLSPDDVLARLRSDGKMTDE